MNSFFAGRMLWIAAAFMVAGLLADGPGHVALGQKQAQPDQAAVEMPAPVVSTHDLMELFNKPLYKDLKKAVAQGDKLDWKSIQQNAQRVAEVANLVAIRPDEKNVSRWMDRARDLRLAAIDLASAADHQEPQKTRSAFGTVVESCNACHRAFAPKHGPQLSVEQ